MFFLSQLGALRYFVPCFACTCIERPNFEICLAMKILNDVSKSADGSPKAAKRRLSVGKIKESGRKGTIVAADPHDKEHTYKMEFTDGQMPAADWFGQDSVELIGAAFTVVLRNPKSDTVNVLSGLKPDDVLCAVYSKAEEELSIEHGRLHLQFSEEIGHTPALDDKLGVLGMHEGTVIEYVVLNDFDKTLVRIEQKSQMCGHSTAGDIETASVVAVVYGRKGSKDQLLLWAAECLSDSGSPKSKNTLPQASLSDDGCALSLVRPGVEVRRHAISSFLAGAQSRSTAASGRTTVSLEQQFKNYFGEEKWPVYTGRVCRLITD